MPRNEYNEAIFPVLLLFRDGGHDLHDLNDLEVNIIGNLGAKSALAHPTCPERILMKVCFQNCHFSWWRSWPPWPQWPGGQQIQNALWSLSSINFMHYRRRNNCHYQKVWWKWPKNSISDLNFIDLNRRSNDLGSQFCQLFCVHYVKMNHHIDF